MVKGKSKIKERTEICTLSRKNCSANWMHFLNSNKINKTNLLCTKADKYQPVRNKKPSKVVSLDCEMVANENGESVLARVSVVDYSLTCIYDKYVKPDSKILDYRTRFSGIRPDDLLNGEKFDLVQREVKKLLHNKFLVGHALKNDLNVLKFGHHQKLIRDTSLFKPFRKIAEGKTPSLRKLVKHFLNEDIQEGEHNSVQDATAAMKLYRKYRNSWEKSILSKDANVSLD